MSHFQNEWFTTFNLLFNLIENNNQFSLLNLIENNDQFSLFQKFHPMIRYELNTTFNLFEINKYEKQKRLKKIQDKGPNKNGERKKRKLRRTIIFEITSSRVPKPYYTKIIY